jgi:hypothetical protein
MGAQAGAGLHPPQSLTTDQPSLDTNGNNALDHLTENIGKLTAPSGNAKKV